MEEIKFVKKEERSSHKHKHKKDKKERHKKKHKDTKHSKKRKDRNEIEEVSSDESDVVDMEKIVSENCNVLDDINSVTVNNKFTRMGWMNQQDSASDFQCRKNLRTEVLAHGSDNPAKNEMFLDLISRLSNVSQDESSTRISVDNNSPSRNEVKQSFSSGQINELDITTNSSILSDDKIGQDNRSVAALLKNKLKRNVPLLNTTENKSSIPPIVAPASQKCVMAVDFRQYAIELSKKSQKISNNLKGNCDKTTTSDFGPGEPTTTKGSSGSISGQSLREMVAFERAGGEDMDSIFCDNVLRLGERYKGVESSILQGGGGDKTGREEEAEIDMSMFQRVDPVKHQMQQQKQAVMRSKALDALTAKCAYCLEGSVAKSLASQVISTGSYVQLRLKTGPHLLLPVMCELYPAEHSASIAACEEEVSIELERYKGCLRSMFKRQGKTAFFLETALKLTSHPHAHIDVVPIENDVVEECKMFFREALTSCDEEWSTNRKVVQLSESKPLQRAVPPHFPYVAAEWEGGGVAHPIENEKGFGPDFCLDIIAGALGLDNARVRRQAMYDSRGGDSGSTRVATFKRDWEPYDWTQYM